jgi:hypothetical protein
MSEPIGLECPLCHAPALPALVPLLGDAQAFCGSDECPVLCWDPSATLAEFHEQAAAIDLSCLDDRGAS